MKSPCANCGKPADQTCGGCDLEVYCDAVCQQEHWPEHQQSCDTEAGSIDVRFGRSKDMKLTAYLALKRDFKTLSELVEKNKLVGALDAASGVTLLAPDNKAFKIFLDKINKNATEDDFKNILLYHVLEEKKTKKDIVGLVSKQPAKEDTFYGTKTIKLSYNDRRKQVLINGDAAVTRPDILVKNSVIHRIDTVLVPDDIAERIFS